MPLTSLVQMAQTAKSGGIRQLWVTDNLQSRNAFVVLAALAENVSIKLGTAVLVQYFRNPIDVADSAAAVSEMMDGLELSLGIARGNPSTHLLVRTPKAVTMLRETAQSLQRLLNGETVRFSDYPNVASYFNLVPERPYTMNFTPRSPVVLYNGGNAPLSLAVGGECMDGLVFGWTFLAAARAGRLASLLEISEAAATKAGWPTGQRRVAEIKIYLAKDGQKARAFCRHAVAGRVLGLLIRGYTPDDYVRLGIEPADVDRLQEASERGVPNAELSELVTDGMIDSLFVAGDAGYCREKIVEVCGLALEHGFEQLMFSELGPDVDEAAQLLYDHVLPAM